MLNVSITKLMERLHPQWEENRMKQRLNGADTSSNPAHQVPSGSLGTGRLPQKDAPVTLPRNMILKLPILHG